MPLDPCLVTLRSLVLGGWSEELANEVGVYDVLDVPLESVTHAAGLEGVAVTPMVAEEAGTSQHITGAGSSAEGQTATVPLLRSIRLGGWD